MASIFIPIADRLARANDINPVYFVLPLTVCVSYAFLFPVATAPNAIIFSCGYIKITDMIMTGIVLKVFGVVALFLAANTWLSPIFPNNIGGQFSGINDNIISNVSSASSLVC